MWIQPIRVRENLRPIREIPWHSLCLYGTTINCQLIQTQHFCHHGDTSYITTKLHGKPAWMQQKYGHSERAIFMFPTIDISMRVIYTTKIDGVVCPPNISETVAGRLMKLAHRQRIASTTIKLSLKKSTVHVINFI